MQFIEFGGGQVKILFISAANKNFDGRTRALLDVLNSFADIVDITTTQESDFVDNNSYYVNYKSYKEFIRKTVEIGKEHRTLSSLTTGKQLFRRSS